MKEHPFYKKKETINQKRQELLDSFYNEVKLMSKYEVPKNGTSYFKTKLNKDKPFIPNEKLDEYSFEKKCSKMFGEDIYLYQKIEKKCLAISLEFLSLHFGLIKNNLGKYPLKKLEINFLGDGLTDTASKMLAAEIHDLNELIINKEKGDETFFVYKVNKIIDSLFSIFETIRVDYFLFTSFHKFPKKDFRDSIIKSIPIWNFLPFAKDKLFYIEKIDLNGFHLNSVEDKLFKDITLSPLYSEIRNIRNSNSHGVKIISKNNENEKTYIAILGALLMYILNYSKRTTTKLKEENLLPNNF